LEVSIYLCEATTSSHLRRKESLRINQASGTSLSINQASGTSLSINPSFENNKPWHQSKLREQQALASIKLREQALASIQASRRSKALASSFLCSSCSWIRADKKKKKKLDRDPSYKLPVLKASTVQCSYTELVRIVSPWNLVIHIYLSIYHCDSTSSRRPARRKEALLALSLLCRRNWCMIGDKKKEEEEETV
jgi:hypothetical protein